MAGNNAFNNNDSMDINELMALNDDISPDLIEQLQQKLSQEAQTFAAPQFDESDDTTLFEEPAPKEETETEEIFPKIDETPIVSVEEPVKVPAEETIPPIAAAAQSTQGNVANDSFAQKYRARMEQQSSPASEYSQEFGVQEEQKEENTRDINNLTNGNITEKAITQAQKSYNDSLDLLDGNVKYSKYVIYIDPQNVDFIEGLTVKERKNLINNILREQDDISITRKKFRTIQTAIKHVIVAILTITISIPIIYWAINASLEASINNYRRSQTNFQTLYKDNGKINVKQP